jgi:hypothetical protein
MGTGVYGWDVKCWIHSTAVSAEIKNEWSYTSAPSICLHGVDRDNFTSLLQRRLFILFTLCHNRGFWQLVPNIKEEDVSRFIPIEEGNTVEPPYPRIRYPRFYRGPKILTYSLPKSTMVVFTF